MNLMELLQWAARLTNHDRIALGEQLAGRVDRHGTAVLIGDTARDMRMALAHRLCAYTV